MNPKSSSVLPVPKHRQWAEKHGTPWEVFFPKAGTVDGKRRFFATEAEALEEISLWSLGRNPSAPLGKRKVDEVNQCESLLPAGVSIRDAVRFYLEHHAGASSVTLKEIKDAFVADLRRLRRAKGYVVEQDRVAEIAVESLGASTLFSSLSKTKLIAFINADKSYWLRYRRKHVVSCLITKAKEMEAIKHSPLEGWSFEEAPKSRPHFLTKAHIEVVLEYVSRVRPDLLAAFVFQVFAGIRTEELARADTGNKRPLLWEDIKFGKMIDVGPEVSKTDSRRVIDFWPEALTKWLPSPPTSGPVCPVQNLDNVKSQLIKAMNLERTSRGLKPVPFRQNDFRRTYLSHAVGLFQDAAKVQLYAGHTNQKMLFQHYRDYIEQADAVLYFASEPCSSTVNSSQEKQTTTPSDSSCQTTRTATAPSIPPQDNLGEPSMRLAS